MSQLPREYFPWNLSSQSMSKALFCHLTPSCDISYIVVFMSFYVFYLPPDKEVFGRRTTWTISYICIFLTPQCLTSVLINKNVDWLLKPYSRFQTHVYTWEPSYPVSEVCMDQCCLLLRESNFGEVQGTSLREKQSWQSYPYFWILL